MHPAGQSCRNGSSPRDTAGQAPGLFYWRTEAPFDVGKLKRMQYQVVARPCIPAGTWDYYPYWAPMRDKAAATRLATYAARTGCEAVILQSVTVEMLQHIACGVVERQDAQLLPAIRYLPAVQVAAAQGQPQHRASAASQREWLEPFEAGSHTIQLDGRRLNIEMGPGGDVTQRPEWRSHISIPCRTDLLHRWMSMRRRLLRGLIGGPLDGVLTSGTSDR
jgi:hypothetical protein